MPAASVAAYQAAAVWQDFAPITSGAINTTTITACDTYTWSNTGQTYTTSGAYIGTTTNSVTEVLYLNINTSTLQTTFSSGGLNYIITSPTTVAVGNNSGASGSISIPASVTNACFDYYTVTSIGDGAFDSCSSLTSVTIPNSVTSIGISTFAYCTGLISVTIPDSVTSIGYDAFFACIVLTSVNIPNSVTSINNSAFGGCSSLTSVTIPDTVTSIGQYAFYGCSGLTSVTIGDSVTSIGNEAFAYCFGLTSVVCAIDAPLSIDSNVFFAVTQSACSLTVPNASVAAYQAAAVWQDFAPITSCTPTVNTTTVTACSNYTWADNTQTYTASGTYTGTTTNCVTEQLVLTIITPPAQPSLACYETASFNTTTCTWDITGTQDPIPTLACYQTASFNTTTCIWSVTGTQDPIPTLACYQTASFNTTTCTWDVTGTQDPIPTLACYQTASFNTTTCAWDITGTQSISSIWTENFDSYNNGYLATDPTGNTPGQGGWYTFNSAPSGANSFEIGADPVAANAPNKAVKLIAGNTTPGNNVTRYAWTNNLANSAVVNGGAFGTMTIKYRCYIGGTSATSTNRYGLYIYDTTSTKILAAVTIQNNTGQFYLVANYNNAGTIANYAFSTGATGILPRNTWYDLIVTFNKVTGRMQGGFSTNGGTSYTMYFVDGAATNAIPGEIDLVGSTNSATSAQGATAGYYDNISVEVTTAYPTGLACYQTATLNATTCTWDVTATGGSTTYYADVDGDGFGDASTSIQGYTCLGAPAGYVTDATDCNDAVAAINPGHIEVLYNGIDDNCDGQLDEGNQATTVLQTVSCGATLTAMGSLVYTDINLSATAYRFKVVNNNTGDIQYVDNTHQWFALNWLASYEYATAYTVSVQLQIAGVWVGYYGTSCVVNSPDITSSTGTLQLISSQCGATSPSIATVIYTTAQSGATGYRFRITDVTPNAIGSNLVQVKERSYHWFTLPMLSRYNYGSTYMIEVAVKTTGGYTGYGSPCYVNTPASPMLNSCGAVIPTSRTLVYTAITKSVTQYRFQVTRVSDQSARTFDTSRFWFSFKVNMPGYTPSVAYSVRVAVMTAGTWSPFGDACEITSPAIPRTDINAEFDFTATVFPNPYSDQFNLRVNTDSDERISFRVYDMLGKLIEAEEFDYTSLETKEFGRNYPAGVYNIIVSQGENVKTLRVIKR